MKPLLSHSEPVPQTELQTIADNVPVLIARVNTDRRYLFANQAYQDRLSIPVDQVVGHTMVEVLGEEAYETICSYVDRVLTGEKVNYEAWLNFATVGPRWIHASYVPERDPATGEVSGFLLSAMDMTAGREAKDANRRLAMLLEHSYEAILSTDLDGTILSWNKGAERIFGYTEEEAIGRSVAILYRPEDAPRLPERINAFVEGINPREYEAVRRRKDGTECTVAYTLWPIHADDGSRTGFASIVRDVTAQKQAEQASRQLALLVESSHDAILSTALDGTILSWNKGAERLYGYTADEAVGRSIALVYPPEEVEELAKRLALMNEGRTALSYEAFRVRKDGLRRLVAVTISPVRGDGGKVTRHVSVARDITAQRAAEETSRRLSLIVEHSQDAIIGTDIEGTILSWNKGAVRLFGYTSEEVLGRSIALIHPPDEAERRQARLESVRQGENVPEYEAVRVAKDGTQRVVSVTVSPIWDGRGTTMSHAAIMRDITAQKEAAREQRRLTDYVRLLLDSSSEGIYGVNRADCFTFLNPAAARMFGAEPDELLGKQAHFLIHHTRSDGQPYLLEDCPIYQATHTGRECRVDEEVFWRLDGTSFPAHYTAAPLFEDGVVSGCVVTLADISERKAWEAERERRLVEATERADRDPLTGLLNHRAFHKRLEEETERCLREGVFLAVAMLDLNHFKFFNDTYGHLVGDDALRRVADGLRQSCRAYDVLARFGGDEFAVLMPGTGNAETAAIADRLAHRLQGLAFRPPGSLADVPLELTMGVALFPEDGGSSLEAVALADGRLYAAKSNAGADGPALALREHLSETVDGFALLDSLVSAIDAKDRCTRRHAGEVLRTVNRLAEAMDLDEETRHTLSLAALLQEVGKIGIPDRILRKPGPLTDAEWETVKQHPTLSALLISSVSGLPTVLDAVKHHHERWDGNGYPAGLAGEDIPLCARLLAVADAFAAMTADRPYRRALTEAQARTTLAEGAGYQWDPTCIHAFLSL